MPQDKSWKHAGEKCEEAQILSGYHCHSLSFVEVVFKDVTECVVCSAALGLIFKSPGVVET